MPNNYFQFKQFRINQQSSAMKVGTDGVLLGAWANAREAQNILDIGTGSGLIAIMLAQRSPAGTNIDAVEIDAPSYQQAVENIANCPWSKRINAFNLSFQDYCSKANHKYDLIVSNPPYFLNGLHAKEQSRTQARHADHLPFEDLLNGAGKLLNKTGIFALILPVEEGGYFERLAKLTGFNLKRKVSVLPNPGKPAKRLLLEFSLKQYVPEYGELVVENGKRHVYSPEYVELTKDFYLKL